MIKSPTNKPNHLASHLERMANAKHALPKHLLDNYQRLQALTQLVRLALQDCLPAPILAQCQVVQSDTFTLTLAVNNHTAAAHLRYLSVMIIAQLANHHTAFSQLHTLKIHAYDTSVQQNHDDNR